MSGSGPAAHLPEPVLAAVRDALRERRRDVRQVLLRSRDLLPATEPSSARHVLTVVLDDPPETREDAEAAFASQEELAEILHPLVVMLEPNVGIRFPSTRALAALEDDNVVVYDRDI